MAQKVLRQFVASKPVSSWDGQKETPSACVFSPACNRELASPAPVLPTRGWQWTRGSAQEDDVCCFALPITPQMWILLISAGTLVCNTDWTLCNSSDASEGWSCLTVISTICIYPSSDLSDNPSKKDTRLALAREQLLWEAVSTGGDAFPLELLFVTLRAHSGAAERPEHQVGCQAQCWLALLSGCPAHSCSSRDAQRGAL